MLCEIHFQEGPQRDSSILKTFITSRKGSFGQGNIFTDVCLSTGGGGVCMMSPPVWLPGVMFLPEGGSLFLVPYSF